MKSQLPPTTISLEADEVLPPYPAGTELILGKQKCYWTADDKGWMSMDAAQKGLDNGLVRAGGAK